VKLALIYPPACDPTAPYPAIPALAGFLRPQGIEVLPIDANLDGFLALLQREPLTRLAGHIERRIANLRRRRALDHQAQLELLALLRVRGEDEQIVRSTLGRLLFTGDHVLEGVTPVILPPDGDMSAYGPGDRFRKRFQGIVEKLVYLLSGAGDVERAAALREFAIGIEALQRFIEREPLRRVHECVFGVLALESEPVDPRL